MKYPTKLEATREWVHGFNAIPYGIIQRLVADDIDADAGEWREVTTPQSGDSVELHFPVYGTWDAVGEVLGYDEDSNDYVIEVDDDTIIHAGAEEFHVSRDSFLPMWRTLWSFGDRADDRWLERGGISIMSECGFRIYKHKEFGYFFGIDGAGFDFYEAYWIPLYEKRGLKWHVESTECGKEE